VFPHHADKALGCMACHKPHGSPNRKLLDQVRARDNCLQCHGDLPSFHDLTPGSRYQNCLDCHVKVHGSNRNRFFFR
ncbi:MAG: cytochrome C, partial [Planctomycetes bacterium]|nr:cytochrome C [Planctomycetota bacterium]